MRVFKPFWSFNIKNIENWLSEKALEGYILKDVNSFFKLFTFEKRESIALNYRISYEKKGITDLKASLVKHGWYKVCNKGRWFFIANEKRLEDIKATPSREPLLNRVKIASIILSIITSYFAVITGMMLIFIVPMAISYFLGNGDITFINEAAMNKIPDMKTSYFTMKDILDCIKLLFIISIFIYPIIKLRKNEKQLKLDLDSNYLEIEEEYKYKNESKEKFNLIERKGPSILEPDKLEQWLERMEIDGFHLEKINKGGGNKFYFSKGTPRKMRYILDFQNDTKAAYYEIFKQDQWNLVYTVGSLPVKWSLWRKEYIDERPNIYTDKEEVTSNAKKMLLTYSVFYLPIITIFLYYVIKTLLLLTSNISKAIEILPFILGIILIMILPLVLFINLYSKVIKFYFRVKNS